MKISAALVAGCGLASLAAPLASAMPRLFNESTICETQFCENRDDASLAMGKVKKYPYERIIASQPGYQWDDAGGYCGSWATQRAVLANGAWISQQQVRDHTSDCGGHDEEILSCNIEEAYKNLKISYDAFDYVNTPLPQHDAYFKWLKAHLAAGHPVAWMIMWSGQNYPIYNLKPPAGMYGHVEPVIGIASNHPLNDTNVYDDDVVLHYTDGGTNTVHRKMSTLPCKWGGVGQPAVCQSGYTYGIGNPYGFGYAVKGFETGRSDAVPASLKVDPWESEPDTRSGQSPTTLKGTLTATELTSGKAYDIYRWDDVANVGKYTSEFKKKSFKATSTSHTYADPLTIASDGTTYYSCVPQ